MLDQEWISRYRGLLGNTIDSDAAPFDNANTNQLSVNRMTHLTETNPASLVIGDIPVSPPLTLAPMAGQTNYAFRQLCREMGGVGLTCTELLSSQSCP